MNNAPRISGMFEMPVADLITYKMQKLKYFRGVKLLPISLSFSAGENIEAKLSEYYVVLPHQHTHKDISVQYAQPSCYWKRYTNVDEILNMYDDPQTNNVTWDYADTTLKSKKEYMPYPTSVGVTAYTSTVEIIVYVENILSTDEYGNHPITEHHEWMNVYYISTAL